MLTNGASAAVADTSSSSPARAVDGGAGAADLARAVVEAANEPTDFKFLYELNQSIKAKIETIAKEIYGAGAVTYENKAESQIKQYETNGFGNLPICMAKTHLSLRHDANLKGRPTGFTLPIREIRASVGAGFLYPLLGSMSTMPGLPTRPSFYDVDMDLETGKVVLQGEGTMLLEHREVQRAYLGKGAKPIWDAFAQGSMVEVLQATQAEIAKVRK